MGGSREGSGEKPTFPPIANSEQLFEKREINNFLYSYSSKIVTLNF